MHGSKGDLSSGECRRRSATWHGGPHWVNMEGTLGEATLGRHLGKEEEAQEVGQQDGPSSEPDSMPRLATRDEG